MTTQKKTKLLPAIQTWEEWAKKFTNAHIWKPAVQEICHRASIPFRNMQAGYPGTNAVFIVNQRFVVKIYSPFCHDDFFLERELLSKLGKNTLIPAPILLAQGIFEDRISWPYIVMTCLLGQPIRELKDKITRTNLMDIADHMGRIVKAIHQTPITSLNNLDHSRNGWNRYVQKQQKSIVKKLQDRNILPDSVVQSIPSFVASELTKYNEIYCNQLNLVHGDLTEDHWLLHTNQCQFADAKISPPTYEWTALWFGALGRKHDMLISFMSSYNHNIIIDDNFYRHALAYTFLHEFGAEIIEFVLQEEVKAHPVSIDQLLEVLWMP